MEIIKLISIVVSLVTGGALWQFFKLIYPDLRSYFTGIIDAKEVLNQNLDPLIKSADELYSKINDLANSDFRELYIKDKAKDDTVNKIYIMYLIATFWARISIIRIEGSFINISKSKRGEQLVVFINTIEERSNRILERSFQRIIGEALLVRNNNKHEIMSLYEFANDYFSNTSKTKKWLLYLEQQLNNTYDKKTRQKFLLYGVLLQALIDHYDPEHKIVSERKSYPNKLSKKSLDDLKYRVFSKYLNFIKNPGKYFMLKTG